MAIDKLLKDAEKCLDSGSLDDAGRFLESALKENSESVNALILMSKLDLRTNKYDEALNASVKALTQAINLGKREKIGEAYYQKGLVYFRMHNYAEALKQATLARKYDTANTEITLFRDMLLRKYAKSSGITEAEAQEVAENPSSKDKTPEIEAIDQDVAPSKQVLRTDWFDSPSEVDISIFVKNIVKDSVQADFQKNSLFVSFEDSKGGKYTYAIDKLYSDILTESSSYRVFASKLEISLAKSKPTKWQSLELDSTKTTTTLEIPKSDDEAVKSYPSSSGKKIDWSKFDVDDNDSNAEDEGDDAALSFFQKLYSNADPDTKRAMMKSYVESNGTSLSTDWSEVSKDKVETVAPEGTQPKEWDS
ncbi:DEKNAAC100739 [Brettanomyces naardenensis]|uniref:DEKNAAC100739 n=1 Tax=Brettanomyces naardenensis TaxID=13370 RepID=A0A448YGB7_BRENA|nr:DEKNAAC100739 [Brettanomyces naardenensis]